MAKALKRTPFRDPDHKQAVIYARVSTKEQERRASPSRRN
jgi:predicted site-specific integrase-resolvase